MGTSLLSTLHRSLIALSALQLGHGPRATILALYHVTEADLRNYSTHWQRLQVVHQAKQARYQSTAWSSTPVNRAEGGPGYPRQS